MFALMPIMKHYIDSLRSEFGVCQRSLSRLTSNHMSPKMVKQFMNCIKAVYALLGHTVSTRSSIGLPPIPLLGLGEEESTDWCLGGGSTSA